MLGGVVHGCIAMLGYIGDTAVGTHPAHQPGFGADAFRVHRAIEMRRHRVSKPHFSHINFVAIAISFFSGTSIRAGGGVEEFGAAGPCPASTSARTAPNFRGPVKLSNSALLTTLTLDSAIASPAKAGFSMIPNHGYRTPAAIGIPSTL